MIGFPLQRDSGACAAGIFGILAAVVFFGSFGKKDEVKTSAGQVDGQGDSFPPTHWTVIMAAAQANEPEVASLALSELAKPIGRHFTLSCAAVATACMTRKI
jgi:hypothetical protein